MQNALFMNVKNWHFINCIQLHEANAPLNQKSEMRRKTI